MPQSDNWIIHREDEVKSEYSDESGYDHYLAVYQSEGKIGVDWGDYGTVEEYLGPTFFNSDRGVLYKGVKIYGDESERESHGNLLLDALDPNHEKEIRDIVENSRAVQMGDFDAVIALLDRLLLIEGHKSYLSTCLN